MKKILIILLAVACLFGAVSCKDTVDKLYKAKAFYPDESEELYVLSQIIIRYVETGFSLQSKETTTVYKSLEGGEPYIDGKLISKYIVEDGEPKYSFTFKGAFEGASEYAKDLNVSFDVNPTNDAFPIIEESIENLEGIELELIDFLKNTDIGDSTYIINLEACGFVPSDFAESSTGKSISAIEANEILVTAPVSDAPYEDYDGETITLLKNSKVTSEFETDRSDLINLRSEDCVRPLTFLDQFGKTNDTFKIDAKYEVSGGSYSEPKVKSIKATVRFMMNYEGSDCCMPYNAGVLLINYNGKDYICPIAGLFMA